ncbi:hypothetical protein CYMTET_52430 [Cymbomonas tetramitiformis]|uniref:Amine oxidase domain-containing protein n=1 Tax=Cymbomonas tetramitiformis TaxID=36881 RepID=A0AAE0ER39_9CHLO|nr:hypothetical protein CYMTET_52430 [Cymbomonas tetramitiformis]
MHFSAHSMLQLTRRITTLLVWATALIALLCGAGARALASRARVAILGERLTTKRPLFAAAGDGDGTLRVAVIGGGIAGAGAAWVLRRSGFAVEVFDARERCGGNAKTQLWSDGVTTGLSVLAWPAQYFRNYQQLLARLEVPVEDVVLPFWIRDESGRDFAHSAPHGRNAAGGESLSPTVSGMEQMPSLRAVHARSLRRWAAMVRLTRRINAWFHGAGPPSLYSMHPLNPLNVLPLRWLAALYGVSPAFWRAVVTPLYASTFLTVHLDRVPAVILPTLDDLISTREGAPRMRSWKADSSQVRPQRAGSSPRGCASM